MYGLGCADPQQLRVGNSLVLSGGRMMNNGTSDVLLWVNADGMATSWDAYSLSYWHNLLEPNNSLHFTSHVNISRGETTAYTSLIHFDERHGMVNYDLRGMRFVM